MLLWNIFFTISASLFVIGALWAFVQKVRRYKRKRFFTPRRILFCTTFVSSALIFIPFYREIELFTGEGAIRWYKIVLASLQHAMRLFALEGDFVEMMDFFKGDVGEFYASDMMTIYTGLMLLFYIFAPILTFQFILSFFKNISAHLTYVCLPFRQIHVFSELNDMTLSLAKNIIKQQGRRKVLIVFTDVLAKTEEENLELIEQAREIRALLFYKDLESIYYRAKHSVRKINFYLMGTDEGEKIRHAKSILEHCNYKGVKLYLFSDDVQSKCFFQSYSSEEKRKINAEIIRVNDIRSLVYKNLDTAGMRLFENARTEGDHRVISAVIVGFGRYGSEMLKALLWYCQLPGYAVKIKVIDRDLNAKSRLMSMCPGIKISGECDFTDQDMRYSVEVVHAVAGSEEFRRAIGGATYVFICLGTDSDNVALALDVRCTLAGQGDFPIIETVVYDSEVKERICPPDENSQNNGMKNYGISLIGDIDSLYAEGTVIADDLVLEGLKSHMRWARPKNATEEMYARHDFYMNDYNFFSSIAKALHARLREKILAKVDTPQTKHVFPFAASADGKDAMASRYYRTILERTKNTDEAAAFSAELARVVDCIYYKLAEIHFCKLGASDKRAALLLAVEKAQTTFAELGIDEETNLDSYVESLVFLGNSLLEEKHGREKTIISALYESIVTVLCGEDDNSDKRVKLRLSLEYGKLSSEEKKEVKKYLEDCSCTYDAEQTHTLIHYAAMMDHIRWNAYMRSEGYTHSYDKKLKSFRHHHMILLLDDLTLRDSLSDI